MSLLGNAARARALRDGDRGEADVARSARLLAVDRSRASRTRESAGPGRARACARRRPRRLLDPSVKVRKRFTASLARRTGRFAPVHFYYYGPRCTEAFPNRESRRSREARASRVEPAAREAETCRTCEYSRASASRTPRAASRVSARVAPPPRDSIRSRRASELRRNQPPPRRAR
jgi:hypothetical protein